MVLVIHIILCVEDLCHCAAQVGLGFLFLLIYTMSTCATVQHKLIVVSLNIVD
jgi:hypothetical protein